MSFSENKRYIKARAQYTVWIRCCDESLEILWFPLWMQSMTKYVIIYLQSIYICIIIVLLYNYYKYVTCTVHCNWHCIAFDEWINAEDGSRFVNNVLKLIIKLSHLKYSIKVQQMICKIGETWYYITNLIIIFIDICKSKLMTSNNCTLGIFF